MTFSGFSVNKAGGGRGAIEPRSYFGKGGGGATERPEPFIKHLQVQQGNPKLRSDIFRIISVQGKAKFRAREGGKIRVQRTFKTLKRKTNLVIEV